MPTICVQCEVTIDEEFEMEFWDYCSACENNYDEEFKCPKCSAVFMGEPILNAFNGGHPLCYECYEEKEK